MIRLVSLVTIVFTMSFFFSQCGKDKTGCWQGYDTSGADAPGLIVCDKTKSEVESLFPGYWRHNRIRDRCTRVHGLEAFEAGLYLYQN
jgi:hypothetical protein